jgi:hypothetical protein
LKQIVRQPPHPSSNLARTACTGTACTRPGCPYCTRPAQACTQRTHQCTLPALGVGNHNLRKDCLPEQVLELVLQAQANVIQTDLGGHYDNIHSKWINQFDHHIARNNPKFEINSRSHSFNTFFAIGLIWRYELTLTFNLRNGFILKKPKNIFYDL